MNFIRSVSGISRKIALLSSVAFLLVVSLVVLPTNTASAAGVGDCKESYPFFFDGESGLIKRFAGYGVNVTRAKLDMKKSTITLTIRNGVQAARAKALFDTGVVNYFLACRSIPATYDRATNTRNVATNIVVAHFV